MTETQKLEAEERENARKRTLDAVNNAVYHALKAGYSPHTIHDEINFVIRDFLELYVKAERTPGSDYYVGEYT